MSRALISAFLLISLVSSSFAVNPDEVLKDPALEARARVLSTELRCLVCQNQSIDDSDAPLAKDLRVLLRERLKAGDSDDQVIKFLVDRYGEFILLKPYFGAHTLLLWLLPFALLLIGGVLIFVKRSKRDVTVVQNALSAEDAERVKQIMD